MASTRWELHLLTDWDRYSNSTSSSPYHGFLFNRGILQPFLGPASSHGLTTRAEFEKTLLEANKLRQRSHRLTLTHGDFRAHNIIVGDDGHLSGFFLFRNVRVVPWTLRIHNINTMWSEQLVMSSSFLDKREINVLRNWFLIELWTR